jgi:hypothetical protein
MTRCCLAAWTFSVVALAADVPVKPDAWKPLFDGKTLQGWKPADYLGAGKVQVRDGAIVLEAGKQMTGIVHSFEGLPRINYEVTLEAKRVDGDDFFCTTTFPIGKDYCSLVVGGWGGSVVGLSSINGQDASENETSTTREFQKNAWYRVRIRVAAARVTAWIDNDKVIDVPTEDRKFTTRVECNPCKPFGLVTWNTAGAIRDIRLRPLTAREIADAAK